MTKTASHAVTELTILETVQVCGGVVQGEDGKGCTDHGDMGTLGGKLGALLGL